MLRDHSNKWKQKHKIFWWKPLCTNHKMPHSFTLIVFLRENELFQRGWGVFVIFVEIPKGWGGHQFPAKMENPGRWGGPNWNSLRGGGLDIFWNYTLMLDVTCHVRLHTLLRVVESCCAKYETSQTFKLPTLLAHQCWELLCSLVPRFTEETHYKKTPNSGCKESLVYSLPFGWAGANIY